MRGAARNILGWLAGVVVAVLLLGGGYLVGLRHAGHDHGPEEGKSTGQEVKQQWTCGMHPFIIRDEPGLCPICHMDLTPVKAGTAGNGGALPAAGGAGPDEIAVDPVTVQNMGVRTEKAALRSLAGNLRTVGLLTYRENSTFSLNSKIDGWVEKLHVNREGQKVVKGQPLLDLYSPELVAAQEEFLLALRNARRLAASPVADVSEGAARLLAAARTRLDYWDIGAAQIAALERSGQPAKTLTLYSRHDGVVTSRKVLEGMRVSAGEELMQVADISRLWVNARLYEYQLPWVSLGQEAEVELPFAVGTVFRGAITHVYPYLDERTRTATARIELDNPGLTLKPQMYATVTIRSAAVQRLAVPADAVLQSGSGQTVFVALGEGRFAARPVRIGLRSEDGYVEVVSGLEAGEQVVVSAQFMLDSESSLREALRKMTAPAPAAAAAEGLPAPGNGAAAGKAPAEPLDDLFR